jgi:hypothetical protein
MLKIEGKEYEKGKEVMFFAISEIKHIEVFGLNITIYPKGEAFPNQVSIVTKDKEELNRVVNYLSELK